MAADIAPTPEASGLPLLAVTLGALMPGLATTILAVANGAIATDLGVGPGDLQWITRRTCSA